MSATLIRGYEVVIGLETHAQLSTVSKIFSGSSTRFGAAPNTHASAVDMALPGTLPVLNLGAVERAIRFGLAVGGQVAAQSIFARKNYFYPDLPKGYQISQYETPVVAGGTVSFLVDGAPRCVHLTRAHLEEDAGKSLHSSHAGQTGIDLNRAGTPLLEIVSEPDMRSSAEAASYARALHTLVMWLDICDGNMQEGSFRCDANVSVRRPGAPLGTRREVKNLNSFRFLQQAIDYEIQWQIDLLQDGGAVQQATVLFDPTTGQTRAMRTKEDAADYRYFPDPDLPPLVIAPSWVERVRSELPELPAAMAARFERDHGLAAADALAMTQSRVTAAYFSEAVASGGPAKLVANWMMGELARRLNAEGRDIGAAPVAAATLAELTRMVADGRLANNAARRVVDALWAGDGRSIAEVVAGLGLAQTTDGDELARIVDAVIAANPKSVAEYNAGKDKAFNALVGQAMKASAGKANPAQVGALLRERLGAVPS